MDADKIISGITVKKVRCSKNGDSIDSTGVVPFPNGSSKMSTKEYLCWLNELALKMMSTPTMQAELSVST